jgi:hypothetical protein
MELDLFETQVSLKNQTSQIIYLGKRKLKNLEIKYGKIIEYEMQRGT